MIPIALALFMSDTGSTSKSLSEVSKMLSEFSKRSAIAVLPTIEKITFSSDSKDMEELIAPMKKDGFGTLMSEVPVFYKMGIPPSHYGILKGLVLPGGVQQSPAYKEVTIPQSAVKDNQITFETKSGEAIRLSTLMSLDLTRRIMVSPYFSFENTGDFPLAMTAKDMSASEFVKALTRGLGGKLAVDSKTYTINFDASNFRGEANKVLNWAQKGVDAGRTPSGISVQYNGGSYSDYQEYQDAAQPAQSNSKPALTAALALLRKTLEDMNDQLVEQTFAYKGTTTRLNLATFTNLQDFAVKYLQAATPQTSAQAGADTQRQPSGRGQSNLAALIDRVDPRSPGRLIITTDFRISLELNLVAGRRQRPGLPQNVDAANKITIQVL